MPARRFREGGSSSADEGDSSPYVVQLEPAGHPNHNHVHATPKQIAFIERLLDERDLRVSHKIDPRTKEDPELYVQCILVLKQTSKSLSKHMAGLWIDRLLELPPIETDSLGELGRWTSEA